MTITSLIIVSVVIAGATRVRIFAPKKDFAVKKVVRPVNKRARRYNGKYAKDIGLTYGDLHR